MPRDYKHRAKRKPKRKPIPGWLWLLTGLFIGLLVAGLVYLKTSTVTSEVVDVAKPERRVPTKIKKIKEVPPAPKPRFDFYTRLPEMEVVIPDKAITGKKREGVRQVERPGVYILQAGSFQTLKQADQLKARLALLGLESSIHSVIINNNETWHRVRVGPYNNLTNLNQARSLLKSNKVDAILIQVKG